MENSVLVAEGNTFAQLVHEAPHSGQVESAALPVSVHVALEILLAKFEDEDEFLLGVDDIVETNDIRVTEFFHKRYFSDCSGGSALLSIEVDLLKRDNFIGTPRTALMTESNELNSTAKRMKYLEDCSVRPLSEFLELHRRRSAPTVGTTAAAKKYLDIIARGCCHDDLLLWTIRRFLIGGEFHSKLKEGSREAQANVASYWKEGVH